MRRDSRNAEGKIDESGLSRKGHFRRRVKTRIGGNSKVRRKGNGTKGKKRRDNINLLTLHKGQTEVNCPAFCIELGEGEKAWGV